MKKLMLASLGVFILGTGLAYAGGVGGCSGGYKQQEITHVQPANNGIVLVETADHRLELAEFTTKEKRYNVKTAQGDVVAANLTKEDLSLQFPELSDALDG